jgi:hypothetical protein
MRLHLTNTPSSQDFSLSTMQRRMDLDADLITPEEYDERMAATPDWPVEDEFASDEVSSLNQN